MYKVRELQELLGTSCLLYLCQEIARDKIGLDGKKAIIDINDINNDKVGKAIRGQLWGLVHVIKQYI